MHNGDHEKSCACAPRFGLRRRWLPSDARHRRYGALGVSRVVERAGERTDGAVATTDPRSVASMDFLVRSGEEFFSHLKKEY